MKKGAWVKNGIYISLIAILFFIGYFIIYNMKVEAQRTFTYNRWLISFVKIICYGGIGVVLGLDNFIKELSKDGKWKVEVAKLIVIGIPSLIFSMQHLVGYIIPSILYIDGTLSTIACVVFGYTLISSIRKNNLLENR